jgi:hypothetical protein
VEESLLDIYSLESKCIRSVATMCHKGFNVDVTKLMELKLSISKELTDKTLEFCTALDSALPEELKLPKNLDGTLAIGKKPKKEFNPGSGVQCIRLFQELGINLPVDGTTGKPLRPQAQKNKQLLRRKQSLQLTLNKYQGATNLEVVSRHKLVTNL